MMQFEVVADFNFSNCAVFCATYWLHLLHSLLCCLMRTHLDGIARRKKEKENIRKVQ